MTSQAIWLGTSWKMNKTLAESAEFIDQLVTVPFAPHVQPFVLPAHTALAFVRDRLPAGSRILLGAQNASWRPEGAGTGEVSMRMVKDAGARLVEMGHSERRSEFGETDQSVAAKAVAAAQEGLIPLICVGEPMSVRTAGDAVPFVAAQVKAALSGLSAAEASTVLIAYEPVWAIGASGRPATAPEITDVMSAIRSAVSEVTRGGAARALLYGGGVSLDNAGDFLDDDNVDGLFVGRAGWDVAGFIQLLRLCNARAEGSTPPADPGAPMVRQPSGAAGHRPSPRGA
jgi:triosephosphate isomerase